MQATGASERWADRLREIFVKYWPPQDQPESQTEVSRKIAEALSPEVERLPVPGSVPGLRQCLRLGWQIYNAAALPSGLGGNAHPLPGAFDDSLRCEGLAGCWAEFDELLVSAGL